VIVAYGLDTAIDVPDGVGVFGIGSGGEVTVIVGGEGFGRMVGDGIMGVGFGGCVGVSIRDWKV